MKAFKPFAVMTLLMMGTAQAGFINPIEFDGSEAQKNEVIEYIKMRVKWNYCERIDMCQATTLRMMEKENLAAFKRMTSAKSPEIMDRVIRDYCQQIDMCDYSTLEMMYNENERASTETLGW